MVVLGEGQNNRLSKRNRANLTVNGTFPSQLALYQVNGIYVHFAFSFKSRAGNNLAEVLPFIRRSIVTNAAHGKMGRERARLRGETQRNQAGLDTLLKLTELCHLPG
jgi:hypothetical protein